MSAFSDAQALYDGEDLQRIMSFCAHHGFVYADNECFLCAYPCASSAIETQSQQVNEIQSKKELDNADCWYVYIASGDIKRAFSVIRPLKYVAYRRMDERFRILDFKRMRRLAWATQ